MPNFSLRGYSFGRCVYYRQKLKREVSNINLLRKEHEMAVKKKAKKKVAKKKVAKRKVAKRKAAKKKVAKRKVAKKKVAKRKVAKKKVAKKKVAKKKSKRKPNAAFMRPMQLSPVLQEVVGKKDIPRTEVTKKLWLYIKKHDLQDPKNRRNINGDAKMRALFGGKKTVSMFEMTKLVSKHMK